MKQSTTEKIDPLARIQEEIKEVVRREEEYRQLTMNCSDELSIKHNMRNDNDNNNSIDNGNDDSFNSISINPIQTQSIPSNSVVIISHNVLDDNPSNSSSLAISVNSKDNVEEHHSDDSGIFATFSPVNISSVNCNINNNSDAGHKQQNIQNIKDQRYIGPNCYNLTPEPPQQKLMRTISTPHLEVISKSRQFIFNSAHKGVMQRFIASRGKLQLKANGNSSNMANNIILNSKNAAALLSINTSVVESHGSPLITNMNTPLMHEYSSIMIPTVTTSSAIIERDADGRPLRPGYVPVELKIQRELKDLKTRESELRKIRKIRQSTSDLLDTIDNEITESDESEVEHCYGPGKLRAVKSISELCDESQAKNSISPRATPSPDFDCKIYLNHDHTGNLRPAISLAELCDLDPENAPSSHRLIAQWESLIQQNA